VDLGRLIKGRFQKNPVTEGALPKLREVDEIISPRDQDMCPFYFATILRGFLALQVRALASRARRALGRSASERSSWSATSFGDSLNTSCW